MRITFLWPLPFICALLGYIVVRMIIVPHIVKAPLVTGMHLEDACTILSERNIPLQIIKYKLDPDTPDNIIISQTPSAYQAMRAAQTMFLTLSKKPKAQTAPDCYNHNKDFITTMCKNLNIKVACYYLKAPYCKHTCFAQYPTPDTALKENVLIIYTASDRNDPILWPNFIGRSLKEVTDFLKEYNIIPHITYSYNIYNNNNLDAFVIDQRPLAGSLIELKEEKKPVVQLKVNT